MSSQRHSKCKVPNTAKNIKKKVPAAGHSVSKDRANSQISVNFEKKTSSTSKLPVRIGGKAPKFETGNGVPNLKGLSITDTKRVDASVGTEPETPPSKAVGTDAKAVHVETSDGTVAQTLSVEPNVATKAQEQCSVMFNDLSVATKAQALCVETKTQKLSSDDLMIVKEESDVIVAHRQLEDETTFEFYKKNLAKLGGSDMNDTVREIGQKLISDEVLMMYSYSGQRTKKRFKDYNNITKLVVAATIESMNRRYFEIYGKFKMESDDEKKRLYDAVEKYFTSEYIKQAERRVKRSMK